MQTKINIPIEIINKILIMRPFHPKVKILRDYVNDNLDNNGKVNDI